MLFISRWDKIVRHLYNKQRPSATNEKNKFQESRCTDIVPVKFSEENEIVPRYSQIDLGHKMQGATNEAFVGENCNCNSSINRSNNYQIVREVKDENSNKTIVVTKL